MRLIATHDNVVLRHVDQSENQTPGGLVLPKGAKGLANQVDAFEVVSVGPKADGVILYSYVLCPNATSVVRGKDGRPEKVLVPDMIDEHGNAYIVTDQANVMAVIDGLGM